MDVDLSAFFGNKRSKRYAVIVEDHKVKKIFVEPDNTSVNGESCFRHSPPDAHPAGSAGYLLLAEKMNNRLNLLLFNSLEGGKCTSLTRLRWPRRQ